MKAIKITLDNRARLAVDYRYSDPADLPLGYWIIASFGRSDEDKYLEGILDEDVFNTLYTKVREIKHGYFEIVRTL